MRRLDINGRSALDLAIMKGNCKAIHELLKYEEAYTFPSITRDEVRYLERSDDADLEDTWEYMPLFRKGKGKRKAVVEEEQL